MSNDDELVGLSDAKGDSEKISEVIKTHLNPIPEFKLSFEKDKDKTFVIVEVMKGQQTTYYYEGNLTNAGALLADESPVRYSRLFCTSWNGLTKASGIVDALDDKEYTGSLVTLLQAGTDFVRNNSKKAWRKVDDGRIEMPDYPAGRKIIWKVLLKSMQIF